jgi:hypothetical protein
MTYEEIKNKWNLLADEFNQWDSLGEDEKIEFAYNCACNRCHKNKRKKDA